MNQRIGARPWGADTKVQYAPPLRRPVAGGAIANARKRWPEPKGWGKSPTDLNMVLLKLPASAHH